MTRQGSNLEGDLFNRYFPGERYSLVYEPTVEETAAVVAQAEAHSASDLLPMLIGVEVTS